MSGPRRRTLSQLLEVCADPEVFRALPDGSSELLVRREDLGDRLGITRGTLYRRLRILADAGLVATTPAGHLVVDVDGVRQRLNPTVVAFPTERTRQVESQLAEQFSVDVDVDGRRTYRREDGSEASLDNVASALDFKSRGTAHWHLQRLEALDCPSPPPPPPAQVAQPGGSAVAQITELLDDLAIRSADLDPADTEGRARIDRARTAVEAEIATLEQLAIARARLAVDSALADFSYSDAAVSAREKPIHDAAVARPEPRHEDALRDPNARTDLSDFEVEVENSAQTQERARDENASRTRHRCKPAPDRDFAGATPGDWDTSDWSSITAPIVEAWADTRHKTATIADHLIDAAQAWPRSYLARAAELLARDIRDGRDIANPGAVFNVAVREGRLDYFPLTPPLAAADPVLAQTSKTSARVAAVIRHLEDGVNPSVLAHITVRNAEQDGHGDPELLRYLVEAVHARLPDDDHQEFNGGVVDSVQHWPTHPPVVTEWLTGIPPVRTAV